MMQDCPKCGFSQPKDRYCANCGLDIEAYIPKSTPLFIRLAKNTAVQISIVLLLITSMGLVIYFSQQKTLSEFSKNIIPSASETPVGGATQDAVPAVASLTSSDANAEDANDSAPPSTQPQMATPPSKPNKIQVQFVEITKSYAAKIISESQSLSQSSQTRVLLTKHKDPYPIYSDANDVEKLPGQKESNLKSGTPITFDFNFPSTEGNEEIGFTLNLLPNQVTQDVVEIDMSAIIILKNTQGNAFTTTESNSTFSFSPNYAIIILGVVPEEKSFEPDIELLSNSPLSILSSPQFKDRQSEFGIYLSVK